MGVTGGSNDWIIIMIAQLVRHICVMIISVEGKQSQCPNWSRNCYTAMPFTSHNWPWHRTVIISGIDINQPSQPSAGARVSQIISLEMTLISSLAPRHDGLFIHPVFTTIRFSAVYSFLTSHRWQSVQFCLYLGDNSSVWPRSPCSLHRMWVWYLIYVDKVVRS